MNNLNDVKKIDTYKTVFQSEALSIDQIDELFRGHTTRIPGVKMYVSGKLDNHADFTKQFDNCIAFSDDEFRNLATGNYALRNNDVIITSGDKSGQTLIVSCCGMLEL